MSVACEWSGLSGIGLSLRRADHSSRGALPSVLRLTGCDHETSIMRRPWPARGCCAMDKHKYDIFDNIRLNLFRLFLY